MLSILNQEPRIFGIIPILKHFINHRKTIIIRRTIFDLEKAKARAHILEGLKKALDIIEQYKQSLQDERGNKVKSTTYKMID